MSIEKDALSFEDQDDVFWVRTVYDPGRLCAKELVRFVNFLKHVLEDESKYNKDSKPKQTFIMKIIILHTLPSGFLSGWYFCASLK